MIIKKDIIPSLVLAFIYICIDGSKYNDRAN